MVPLSGQITHRLQTLGVVFFRPLRSQYMEIFDKSYQGQVFVGVITVIHNALIKSSLLYGSETWRLTGNNKRRVEGTQMDALRRSYRISRKGKKLEM